MPKGIYERSPEHRAKAVQAQRDRWADSEYKTRVSKAVSQALTGKPKSPEHRAAISAALRKT